MTRSAVELGRPEERVGNQLEEEKNSALPALRRISGERVLSVVVVAVVGDDGDGNAHVTTTGRLPAARRL